MKATSLARLVLLFGAVSAIWLLPQPSLAPWLAPPLWGIGAAMLLGRPEILLIAVLSLTLVLGVEIGKAWSVASGLTHAVAAVLADSAPTQLRLLTFVYLPVMTLVVELDERRLPGDLQDVGLWRVRALRWLCIALVFTSALKAGMVRRHRLLKETLAIRGLDAGHSPVALLLLWLPALVRLAILDALERGRIHGHLGLKLEAWEPAASGQILRPADRVCILLAVAAPVAVWFAGRT